MKNMKVSKKLITSFMVVVVLTAIVGIIGIYGMLTIDGSMTDMYVKQTVPMPDLAKVSELLQRQRACMREFIIGAAVDDFELIEDAHDRATDYSNAMQVHLDIYRDTITSDEALALFNEAEELYKTDFADCMNLIYTLAESGADPAELYRIMREYTPAVNKIVENLDACLEIKIDTAYQANEAATLMAKTMLAVIITVLAIAVVTAVFFAFYISKLISTPLTALSAFMKKAGTQGDITLSEEDVKVIGAYAKLKDEVGETIGSAAAFVERITDIAGILEAIASGDLSVDIKALSERDVIGKSLADMVENLNNMFGEISSSSTQVSTGSKQVADSAQSLAQGSTEQAASIEQLSGAVNEISKMTVENAQMAERAAQLAGTIMQNAEKGNRQMGEMMTAVSEINQASQSISKVIKVIDDIAFQTNILALNAAVEAARAGQHGKGFAVVAEEVRNLAAKSANAAKETGEMIQNSMDKAELGSRIAGETAESLSEIVSGISESSLLIEDIAKSSEKQSQDITQINTGIDQVAQVVHQNSATAEQSAAASQEMSAQSSMLQELMTHFKLKEKIINVISLQ